ncbi:MAG: helix-turn-helix domain-containing protein [Gemmatimonas sp.]|jgi:DNA-binding Xre family transcriptional regulator|uniref:helix-turn-helix domain-containing protein n=1 Tax=Gemmatimonas sp. TaxID=1962908 RepID=UPI0022C9CD07|nr:helix-turn-helix transcriptional regulator [Gemmatimonas sp.]MCZ8267336.1 helix-turn-helix transcriptional regulator [Gemmatimonas sp.]
MTPFSPEDAPRLRLRLPELLAQRGISWLKLAELSNGRISRSTAHRLVKERDRLKMFDAAVLETLCELLSVTPSELLERPAQKKPTRKPRGGAGPLR